MEISLTKASKKIAGKKWQSMRRKLLYMISKGYIPAHQYGKNTSPKFINWYDIPAFMRRKK